MQACTYGKGINNRNIERLLEPKFRVVSILKYKSHRCKVIKDYLVLNPFFFFLCVLSLPDLGGLFILEGFVCFLLLLWWCLFFVLVCCLFWFFFFQQVPQHTGLFLVRMVVKRGPLKASQSACDLPEKELEGASVEAPL